MPGWWPTRGDARQLGAAPHGPPAKPRGAWPRPQPPGRPAPGRSSVLWTRRVPRGALQRRASETG
eukprot:13644252-Alexandrium_andersonii.AAC.1